ncbi:putative ribonuclease H domain-containing protein [Arabidopsis thaliana]
MPPPQLFPTRQHKTREEIRSTLIINSDAAYCSQAQTAGLGWTLLSSGACRPSKHSTCCKHVSSLLVTEALAARSALMAASHLIDCSVVLKSYCQVLVKAIVSKSPCVEIHSILSDILLLSSSFKSFSCKFILRTPNCLADSQAKSALSLYPLNLV